MDRAGSARTIRSAGASANRTVAPHATAAANPTTIGSIPTSSSRGIAAGATCLTIPTIQEARARPAAPPASASTSPSIRSCRTMRPSTHRAPLARRAHLVALSPASSRLMTFAQAMSRRRPTAAIRINSAGRTYARPAARGAAAAEAAMSRSPGALPRDAWQSHPTGSAPRRSCGPEQAVRSLSGSGICGPATPARRMGTAGAGPADRSAR